MPDIAGEFHEIECVGIELAHLSENGAGFFARADDHQLVDRAGTSLSAEGGHGLSRIAQLFCNFIGRRATEDTQRLSGQLTLRDVLCNLFIKNIL